MKNLFNKTVCISLVIVLIGGCREDEVIQNCEGDDAQQIETFYTAEFGNTPCSLQNINSADKVVNIVIKTQADYEKYFTCISQPPTVDFEKYFIIAGNYRHHQCALFKGQKVLLCNNKIIYRVFILKQICDSITDVFYVTVIEKKYENLPIEFDVKFIN